MHEELDTMTFESFFIAEFPRLVSTLTAWSGDRSLAEDHAQDALLSAELELIDCSVGSVKTQLQRGRQRLARTLGEESPS